MRLQTTCKLDNALSGLEIIEFLIRKEQFLVVACIGGSGDSLVFLPVNGLSFIHVHVKKPVAA